MKQKILFVYFFVQTRYSQNLLDRIENYFCKSTNEGYSVVYITL